MTTLSRETRGTELFHMHRGISTVGMVAFRGLPFAASQTLVNAALWASYLIVALHAQLLFTWACTIEKLWWHTAAQWWNATERHDVCVNFGCFQVCLLCNMSFSVSLQPWHVYIWLFSLLKISKGTKLHDYAILSHHNFQLWNCIFITFFKMYCVFSPSLLSYSVKYCLFSHCYLCTVLSDKCTSWNELLHINLIS